MRLRASPRLFCLFSFFCLLIHLQALPADARPTASSQGKEEQAKDRSQELIKQGEDFARARQFEKAAELFKQAIAEQPASAKAYADLSYVTLMQGRAQEAMALAQKAVELDANSAPAYVALGNVNQALNRFDEAIENFKQAVRLNPNYVQALGALGSLYGQTHRYEESLEALTKAQSLDPNHPDIWNSLGIAYYRLGRHEEGIAAVKKAISLAPNFVNAYINLGNWYNELERYEEAADAYSQVIRLAPRFPSGYYNRSLLSLYLGRGGMAADDARSFLNVADWYRERSPYMVIVAVLGYQQSNREAEAAKTLEIAVKRCNQAEWPYPVIRYLHHEITAQDLLKLAADNDKMTEAQAYIGMSLLLAGQRDEAMKCFQWVKENGNKTFIEYRMVMTELARTGKSK